MLSRVAILETFNESKGKTAPSSMSIVRALIANLECGILCLKNVQIMHNGGKHCILVRDLSRDMALGELIQAAVERFNRLKEVEITIAKCDIPREERFNYSYIVAIQQEKVKAELP